MRIIAIGLLSFVAGLSPALALELQWPDGPNGVLPKATYFLPDNAKLEYDSLTFEDGTILVLSGHDFDLHIRNSLVINGTLTIRSFDPPGRADTAIAGGTGNPGTTYDRGPKSEGAGTSKDGTNGGAGGAGGTGTKGATGTDAGLITLSFDPKARASGNLVIANVGQDGGKGGTGGHGGLGGDGQQGGRGDDGGVLEVCPHGPGTGGKGGAGGSGGLGGDAGDGGRGGIILIQSGSKTVRDWIGASKLTIDGGKVGMVGDMGPNGAAGQPGYGGRGSHECQGKEAERMGLPADATVSLTQPASTSVPGAPGKIKSI
jgi:hypothetical protein